jgi:hypothetical protein
MKGTRRTHAAAFKAKVALEVIKGHKTLARQRVRGAAAALDQIREEVYLHAYDSVTATKEGLERYISKYNQIRPHSSAEIDLT